MATHLITGFPGFIGRRLVSSLLGRADTDRVVALVEERALAAAREAAQAIDPERIELISGDITIPGLGLSRADHDRLAAETEVVHHLAAVYDLAVGVEVAERVNVVGTGNVLDFCMACERLRRHNYVSTAYVAGERTGTVFEHELALGQSFKNHYESTKFRAEVWVRETMDRIPTTIFRPAIVVGDSQTGETQKFDGPYYLLRFIAAVHARGTTIPNIGRGASAFNVVPVDFVVDAMSELGAGEVALGETLHLCDPDPLSAAEVFNLLCRLYADREPSFSLPSKAVAATLRVPALRRAFGGSPPEAIRYLNHPVLYDTRRADQLLSAAGLRCPAFSEYAPSMVSFFRAHAEDAELLGEA